MMFLNWKVIILTSVLLVRTQELNDNTSNENEKVKTGEEDILVTEIYNRIDILPEDDGEKPHTDLNNNLISSKSSSNITKTNSTQKTVQCKQGIGGAPVEIVNGTQLVKVLLTDTNVTSKDIASECVLVLFYAKFCPFSSNAAPHFNALSRAFPDIKLVAIDAMKYHIFNTQNGIVGVPTLILFHNGRPIGKFNDTDYTLELFSKFLTKHTGIKAEEKSYVTSGDFAGPVPSVPEMETDYILGLSWLFIIICGIYYFSKSKWWKWIVETIQNTWREAEAQHEHND